MWQRALADAGWTPQPADFLEVDKQKLSLVARTLALLTTLPAAARQVLTRYEDLSNSPELALDAKVALANHIPGVRAATAQWLQRYLGEYEATIPTRLDALLEAHPAPWVAGALEKPLASAAARGGDEGVATAILLASWGTNAAPLARLVAASGAGASSGSGAPLPSVLCSIAHDRLACATNWITSASLKGLGTNAFERGTWSLSVSLARHVIAANDLPELFRRLGSADRQEVLGALVLVRGIGLPAKQAEPLCMRLLQASGDDEIRILSALTLGSIAPPESVDALKQAGGQRASDSVRHAVEQAVSILNLKASE